LALPRFSQRSFEELKATMLHKSIVFLAVIIIIIVLYISLAPIFFHVLFPQYYQSITFSRIYAFSLIGVISIIPGTMLVSQQKIKRLYVSGLIDHIMRIIFLLLLIPIYGIYGAIWAIIATKVITVITSYAIANKK
jgi:O-antigen/teichoic acid export membrane protein